MISTRCVATLGALSLALTACADAEDEVAAEPSETAVVDHCTYPLAGQPTQVNAQELAYCQAEALGTIAGWVQEDTVDGELASISRVNIDPLAVEIQAYAASGEPGPRAILVRGNTFLERDGQWIQTTTDSEDETMAYQATMPMRFEALLNPAIRAAGTNPDLTYNVLGREEIDGERVTVLSLRISSEAEDGDTRESRLYIRDDYVVVQSETTFYVNGTGQVRASVLTTIDEPQEIINPRFETDEESGISNNAAGNEAGAEPRK